tara:strand:- start:523 stop:4413 length:3891 start_codon:yes stop_codon:yes gene_type:complete
MNATLWHKEKPFRNKLISDVQAEDKSNSLDYVRERAIEAGYLPEGADINALTDAMAEELAGKPTYSEEDRSIIENKAADDAWIDSVMEAADRLNIDTNGKTAQQVADEINAMPAPAYGMVEKIPPRPSQDRKADFGWNPGAKYLGKISQKYDPDQVAAAYKDAKPVPLRREEIMGPLLEAFDIPLYTGRKISKSSALGHYTPGNERVWVANHANIETLTHEVAHLLDDRLPEIKKLWHKKRKKKNPNEEEKAAYEQNAAIRKELKGVSYDVDKLYEGFAEFVRHWASRKEEAQERAPVFYDWFENFVETNEQYGPALRNLQNQIHAYYAQDAMTTARGKFGEEPDYSGHLTKRKDEKIAGYVDDLHGALLMEMDIEGRQVQGGVYETMRNARGVAGVVEGAVEFGAPKWLDDGSVVFVDLEGNPDHLVKKKGKKTKLVNNPKYKGGGMAKIFEDVLNEDGSLENVGLYMVGKRADFLRRQGREKRFNPAEIEALLALETPARKKAFEDYQKFNKQLLDFAQRAGVINGKNREEWETDVYVPFYPAGQGKPNTRSSQPGAMNVIVRLRGSETNLGDPIENIISNTNMLIRSAVFANARHKAIRTAGKKRGGKYITKIPKADARVQVLMDSIRQSMRDNFDRHMEISIAEEIENGGDQNEVIDKWRAEAESFNAEIDFMFDKTPGVFLMGLQTGLAPKGNRIVADMVDGKPIFYYVPLGQDLFLTALEEIPRSYDMGPILEKADTVRRVGQASITYALDFMWRNFVRDPISATVLSRYGFVPGVDNIKGMISYWAQDPTYREYLANGGAMASFWTNEEKAHKNLEAFHRKVGVDPATVLNTPRNFVNFVQKTANSFEVATRLGAGKRAREGGVNATGTVYEERDITTDFQMNGAEDWIQTFYKSVMFLKPGIEGIYKTYRGLATQENRAQVAKRLAALTAMSMANHAINMFNPLYNDLEDWDKNSYWHFYIPTPELIEHIHEHGISLPEGRDPKDLFYHGRLPKPWEIGGVSTLAERAMEGLYKKEPEQVPQMLKALWEMFRLPVAPQFMAPIIELFANRNFFTERKIETTGDEGVYPWARTSDRGSRTLQWYGLATRNWPKWMQLSPRRMKHLLRGYLNAWAEYGLMLSDAIFFDEAQDIPIDRLPGIRSFHKKTHGARSAAETKFYDWATEATMARQTAKRMVKRGFPEIADELRLTDEYKDAGLAAAAKKTVSGFNSTMNRISTRKELKDVQAEANRMARNKAMGAKVRKIKASKDWQDIGALKAELLIVFTDHRTDYMKGVLAKAEKNRNKRNK